jgi:hypothetical protein
MGNSSNLDVYDLLVAHLRLARKAAVLKREHRRLHHGQVAPVAQRQVRVVEPRAGHEPTRVPGTSLCGSISSNTSSRRTPSVRAEGPQRPLELWAPQSWELIVGNAACKAPSAPPQCHRAYQTPQVSRGYRPKATLVPSDDELRMYDLQINPHFSSDRTVGAAFTMKPQSAMMTEEHVNHFKTFVRW